MRSNPESSSLQWYCVRAQTKREGVAGRSLGELDGVEVFCPQLRYPKMTRRGKVMWQEALFPGYLLAKFSLEENERLVKSAYGVRGLVMFGQKTPFISSEFVEGLRAEWEQFQRSEDGCVTLEPQVELNEEIEVATGPLQGMSGVVVEILSSTQRVQLLLEMMGGAQVVELDLFSLLLPRRKPLFAP